MPTFEDMQVDCSNRMVAMAKYGKLGQRFANLLNSPYGAQVADIQSDIALRYLATEYIPLKVHTSQVGKAVPLDDGILEHIKKIDEILNLCVGSSEATVDKRREAMRWFEEDVHEVMKWFEEDVREANERLVNHALKNLNDERPHSRNTRQNPLFDENDFREFLGSLFQLRRAAGGRITGISSIYADHMVDDISKFRELDHVIEQVNELNTALRRGTTEEQRKEWGMLDADDEHGGMIHYPESYASWSSYQRDTPSQADIGIRQYPRSPTPGQFESSPWEMAHIDALNSSGPAAALEIARQTFNWTQHPYPHLSQSAASVAPSGPSLSDGPGPSSNEHVSTRQGVSQDGQLGSRSVRSDPAFLRSSDAGHDPEETSRTPIVSRRASSASGLPEIIPEAPPANSPMPSSARPSKRSLEVTSGTGGTPGPSTKRPRTEAKDASNDQPRRYNTRSRSRADGVGL